MTTNMAELQNLVLELAYTAHVRVNLLVTSPSEHSPFLDMTISTMQK